MGLGMAGRRPELVKSLVIGNTWAWPKADAHAKGFSRLMGGLIGRFVGLTVSGPSAFTHTLSTGGRGDMGAFGRRLPG